MDQPVSHAPTTASRHSRQLSRRQALPRRSTKGPLDSGGGVDDPLAAEPEAQPEPESDVAPSSTSSSQLLPPQDSKPAPSPQPQSQTPPVPEPSVNVVERPTKNFGYLLKAENFLPLNDQEIPTPFRNDPSNQPTNEDISTLLSTGHFRTAATLAADTLKSLPDPTNHTDIFNLLYTRLICLQLLNLEPQAAQEAKCLQDLNAPFYRDRTTTKHIVPWDLRVLAIRLHAIGFGDWRRGIMAYYDLARDARFEFRKADAPEERRMWKGRLKDLGMRVANALMEIGDVDGAVRHLESLPVEDAEEGALMRTRLAFALLKCGDVQAALARLQSSSSDDTPRQIMRALIEMSKGDFAAAINMWQTIDTSSIPAEDDAIIAQNLALCHLYVGDIHKARDLLESLIDQHGHIHGIVFNLSTIYELCSEKSRDLKLKLAKRVAEKEGTSVGWDMGNADFKL